MTASKTTNNKLQTTSNKQHTTHNTHNTQHTTHNTQHTTHVASAETSCWRLFVTLRIGSREEAAATTGSAAHRGAFGDVVPLVPALADSAPQMVDQLVAVLARHDTPIADQVTEVPKVSCPPRCGRTFLCTPQTAEQLVTVPTILYFLKQTVDTRGRSGGPQGFLPEQRRPPAVEQNVDIPAPGRGVQRGLQSFLKDGVQWRLVEQNIVFQQRLPSRTLTFQSRGSLARSLCFWLFKLIRSIA